MRIVEPQEGATIIGKNVSIVLGQPFIPDEQGVDKKKNLDTLTPLYQIWVDGKNQGNLPSGQNVFVARDLSYGPHKITIIAKNTAGEVVDRKELNVTTTAATESQTTTTQTIQPAAPAPEAAPAPAPVYVAPPAPEPVAPSTPTTLPATGSSAPNAAAAGLALLIAGLALNRRA